MLRSVLVALVSTALLSAVAAAAPHSLGKGHWSLGYTASDDVNVQFGIGVADMSRLIVNASAGSADPGDVDAPGMDDDVEIDSVTKYSVGAAFHRYLGGMSTDQFSPFFGFGVEMSDVGEVELEFGGTTVRTDPDPGFSVDGRFGAEAFVVEPLSIGGFVGIGFEKDGDFEFVEPGDTEPTIVEGDQSFGTVRSAITATLYWGSERSPESE